MENVRNETAAAPETSRTIALWGASQVGKTTTLASYFGKETPAWIDQRDSDTRKTLRGFRKIWDALRRNQLVAGTASPKVFSLRHVDGTALGFRDMQGILTRFTDRNVQDAEALNGADAALVFCEWPGPRMADSVAALENALIELFPRHPTALVITKCEAHLSEGEFLRFASEPLEFARKHARLAPLLPLMERFRAHFQRLQIAPITVYGWNGGRPAHFYDEFGRLVPWNIRPAEVDRPFDFILHALRNRMGSGGSR